jgi:hypothetical protein
VESTVTETSSVIALRLNHADAQAHISRSAKLFRVTLDSVEERLRRLNVEFVVTVTGDADRIVELRKTLGGKGTTPTAAGSTRSSTRSPDP